MESSRLQNSMEVSNILEVGQCLQGSVDQIIDAGVYVKLDKNRGFIRQSELTVKTINHPSDVVQMNEKVEVIVINPNQGNDGQLPTLRLKSKHDEWGNRVKEKYQENSKHPGTVTNVDSEHGTFVEFEKGITGLIHHSNMPDSGEPKKDEEIDVIISRINYEEERLALSLP